MALARDRNCKNCLLGLPAPLRTRNEYLIRTNGLYDNADDEESASFQQYLKAHGCNTKKCDDILNILRRHKIYDSLDLLLFVLHNGNVGKRFDDCSDSDKTEIQNICKSILKAHEEHTEKRKKDDELSQLARYNRKTFSS
jgi:hypothetical protein